MIEDDAKKALLKLFQCFNATGSDTERRLKFEAYWSVLRELPTDTIVVVCRKAARGEVCDHGFLPTSAELYQAGYCLLPLPREYLNQNQIERHISPEERELVNEGLRQLRAEIRKNSHEQAPVNGCLTLGQAAERSLSKWKSYELAANYGPVVPNKELREMDEGEREKHRSAAEDCLNSVWDKLLPKLSAELRAQLGAGIPEFEG